MLRFGGRNEDGKRLIGMLLSLENLERLRAGKPIVVDGETVGADDVIVIIFATQSPEAELVDLVEKVRAAGGKVESLGAVLRFRDQFRALGGDPDGEPDN